MKVALERSPIKPILTLLIVCLLALQVPAQTNVEDESSEETPFELLWGFDTGG